MRRVGVLFAIAPLWGQLNYQAPPNYRVEQKGERWEFTRIDNQRKFYCMIALFPLAPSRGTTRQDLDADWNDIAAKAFQLRGTPTTRELPLQAAPKSLVRAGEGIDANNKTVIATMFVLAFPSQYATVVFSVPRAEAFEACQADINNFITSVALAPAGSPSSVAGSWQRVDASTSTGPYNALNQFRHTRTYRFEANNRYTADLLFENHSRGQKTRVLETGRYTVAKGVIHFEPAEYSEGVSPRDQNPTLVKKATPAPYERRFTIGEHSQYSGSAGLQLIEPDGAVVTFTPLK